MTTEIKGRRVHALINTAPYLLLTLKSDLLGLPLVVQALDVILISLSLPAVLQKPFPHLLTPSGLLVITTLE